MRDAACAQDVVFLDQERVKQTDAVIGATAATHGVLLRHAQSGNRLARVQHPAARMLDGVDMFRLADYEISGVYVSEGFRDMVVKSQLSGLLWEELV